MADEIEEGGDPVTPLPSSRDDEFRPFVRRLPEWQFWCVVVQPCMFILKFMPRFLSEGSRPPAPLSSLFSVHYLKSLMFLSIGPS